MSSTELKSTQTRSNKVMSEIINDRRWAAIITRDVQADEQFYYSVKTTGIYCRPSCASRQARPENVQFHETREAAEQAGFHPCKRCKPDQPSLSKQHAATVERICRFIEKSETVPTLDELAKQAGLSTYYFHRLFKTMTGLTPKAYVTAHQHKRIKNELDQDSTISHAIVDAGYNSNSRFYEQSNQLLGMTPTNYRSGGSNTTICFAIIECALGSVLVACSDRGVCAISLGDDPNVLLCDLLDRFPNAELIGKDSEFEQLVATVISFVELPSNSFQLPLDIRGTAFQQRVWQVLRKIPAGTTASYGDIAIQIGSPKSARAVANACAANTLAVAIPCHRVIRNDGGISGYRWGVERKRALLKRESTIKK